MIEIWIADSEKLGAIERDLLNFLDPVEEERARRYRHGRDARNHLISRILLRSALSRAMGGDPRDWRFITGDTGKVMLAHRDGAPFVDFSISHCDGAVAVAVSRSGKIGIDVESMKAERVFAKEEVRRSSGLIRLWTRKEAYAKLLGVGIGADTTDLEIEAPRPAGGVELESHDVALSSGNYQLSVAYSGPRQAADVQVLGSGADLRSLGAPARPLPATIKIRGRGKIPLWILPESRLLPAR